MGILRNGFAKFSALQAIKVGKELRERVNGGRRSTVVAAAAEPAKLA